MFPFLKNKDRSQDLIHAYSSETVNGKEAEFIDELLPEKQKAVRFFRILFLLY